MGAFAEGTPTVTIRLGGKDYTLGYTLGSMLRAKDLGVLNVDVEDPVERMLKIPEYVWCCFDAESRKELTLEAVRELLNPTNIREIGVKVEMLFLGSLPDGEPDPNVEPPAVKEPTGGNSTSRSFGQSESMISA